MLQLDFFKKQPEKIKEEDRVDLHKIKFVPANLGIGKSGGRTWVYTDFPEGKYFIYKTGGVNRFKTELGAVFPKVISMKTETERLPCLETGSDAGYLSWSFWVSNKKSIKIKCHRLVAEAFLENEDPEYFSLVDHKNKDMRDYRVENLAWVTPSQNALNKHEKGKHIKDVLETIKRRGFAEGGFVG